MEVDIALENDGTRIPYAGRNNEMSPTLGSQSINSFGKGVGTETDACRVGTKVLHTDFIVRDDGGLHFRHFKRQVVCILLVRVLGIQTQERTKTERQKNVLSRKKNSCTFLHHNFKFLVVIVCVYCIISLRGIITKSRSCISGCGIWSSGVSMVSSS